MDEINIFSVILAVMCANAATAAFIYALVRLSRVDKFEKGSTFAIFFFSIVLGFSAYLAA